jgi:hypothetical protein
VDTALGLTAAVAAGDFSATNFSLTGFLVAGFFSEGFFLAVGAVSSATGRDFAWAAFFAVVFCSDSGVSSFFLATIIGALLTQFLASLAGTPLRFGR